MTATVADRSVVLPNGLAMNVLSAKETMFLYEEIFVTRAYAAGVGEGLGTHPIVVDAGANIGMFTLFAHLEWPGVSVIALEPIPQIHAVLQRNVERHHVAATLLCSGLSASNGESEFRYYPKASVLSGAERSASGTAHLIDALCSGPAAERMADLAGGELKSLRQQIERKLDYELMLRPTVTLSHVIASQGLPRIDLLKVDVEGEELQVLQGIDEAHWPKIQRVVMETDDRSQAEVIALLWGENYDVRIVQQPFFAATSVTMVHATRRQS